MPGVSWDDLEGHLPALDDLIADRLMDDAAKKQGIDRSALVEKEITSKIHQVTDDDVAFWYQTNQARVQGASLEQARQPIKAYLTDQRMQEVRERYLLDLKSKTPAAKPSTSTGQPGEQPSPGINRAKKLKTAANACVPTSKPVASTPTASPTP